MNTRDVWLTLISSVYVYYTNLCLCLTQPVPWGDSLLVDEEQQYLADMLGTS